MKKLLLLTALGIAGLIASAADDYTVYSNGVLAEGLEYNHWWNAAWNGEANDPAGGSDKVFKFYASGAEGRYDAGSMGFMTSPGNFAIVGPLNTATLTFDWYQEGPGDYIIRLTGAGDKDANLAEISSSTAANTWNTATINIPQMFPELAAAWKEANEGNFFVFAIVYSDGSEESALYVNNVVYSNLDDTYIAPPPKEYLVPGYVNAPTTPPADVLSLFSSAYPQATEGFGIGGWSQATEASVMTVDDQEIYFFKNFDYLGWELRQDIDVSDYEYLHVEYWTPNGTTFGITPVCRTGSLKEELYIAPTVVQEEWNIYNIPMSEFSSLTLTDVFQMKFDKGGYAPDNDNYGYIANVYFWKEGEASAPVEVPTNLYLLGDTYAWNQEYVSYWNPAEALAFTATDQEGVFTIEAVQFNNVTSYFTFTNILDEDWDVINDGTHRYCPVTMLAAASVASENPFRLGTFEEDAPDSWTITPGVYDITVDFETMTFTVAVSDVEAVQPPTVTVPEALYLIGNFPTNPDAASWDISNTLAFTAGEEGVFTLTGAELSSAGGGLAYFGLLNIKATTWDDITLENRYGPEVDSAVSFTAPNAFDFSSFSWNIEPGFYDFTVDFNTLEMTVTESESEAVKGLNTVNAEENVYYNLQGVRVANPQKGIYILNGKKVLVK